MKGAGLAAISPAMKAASWRRCTRRHAGAVCVRRPHRNARFPDLPAFERLYRSGSAPIPMMVEVEVGCATLDEALAAASGPRTA